MTTNIFFCNDCGQWNISEEKHDCPLKDVSFIGQTIINNICYITSVSKDGFKWKTISPILPPKSKHPFSTPDDETEQKIILNVYHF